MGGVKAQSHTVASESVGKEVVKDALSEDYAFDPKITGSEYVFAVSPIFNPVSTLSQCTLPLQPDNISVRSRCGVNLCIRG